VFVIATAITGRDKNNVAFSRQGGRLVLSPAAAGQIGQGVQGIKTLQCQITDRAPDCSQATLACSDQSFHVIENRDPATGFSGAFDGVPVSHGVMDISDLTFCPTTTAQ
jgi:hypothetical protein